MSRQQSLFQNLTTDNDRSVSPVIGVILMVAITVILAAVIGAFALGFTDSFSESPPQADLNAEQGMTTVDDNNSAVGTPNLDYKSVTITHESGEDISKENIEVTVNGEPAYSTLDPADEFYDFGPTEARLESDLLNPWDSVEEDTISVGDQTIIVLGTTALSERDQKPGRNEVTFLHQGTVGDKTSVVLWDAGGYNALKDDVELKSGDTVRMVWETSDRSVPLVEYEVE